MRPVCRRAGFCACRGGVLKYAPLSLTKKVEQFDALRIRDRFPDPGELLVQTVLRHSPRRVHSVIPFRLFSNSIEFENSTFAGDAPVT